MSQHERWLDEAIRLAEENVAMGGGPFGALVVRGDTVVGSGVNSVHQASDPTAHAELLAIREACISLGTTDLSDCVVYASGEPCPMCMGAIYWSRPRAVYFACSKREAGDAVGFTDPLAHFYADLNQPPTARSIPLHKVDVEHRLAPFRAWHAAQG